MPRWATFDCYGTLIDWNRGIRAGLASIWPEEDADSLLRDYHELEPRVEEAWPGLAYRAVMAEVVRGIRDRRGLALGADEDDVLARRLPEWGPFPEVPEALAELRERGWRLALLSNSDPDLIEASIARLGVGFEEVVTAAEARSYKPAHGHWRVFFERTGAAADEHVHVAQSLFHDIAPAQELGLATVWINRAGERPGPAPTRELPDLADLPATLAALRP